MKVDNTSKIIDYKKLEIKKIELIIISKYSIYNKKLSYALAEELYNNGIFLEYLENDYYFEQLNLDEIIKYLIRKFSNEEKIIKFKR